MVGVSVAALLVAACAAILGYPALAAFAAGIAQLLLSSAELHLLAAQLA